MNTLRAEMISERGTVPFSSPGTGKSGQSPIISNGVTIAALPDPDALAYDEPVDRVNFHFGVTRRKVLAVLGAGLVIAVAEPLVAQDAETPAPAQGQGRGGRGGGGGFGGGPTTFAARLHIGKDGKITVFTGKVEGGQGARAELTQAAAEELRVPLDRVDLIMADTALVPNDGGTFGSQSTPRSVPAIRQGAAAARNLLVEMASNSWNVDRGEIDVRDGKVVHKSSGREQTYADLASAEDATEKFKGTVPQQVTLTPVKEWKVMGVPTPRPNRRDLVTGKHQYPSDIVRPGMLFGKILRPISYGAKLKSIDLEPAKAMEGVVVVKDGDFVGVAAPSTHLANQALAAISKTAQWDRPEHVANKDLFTHLEKSVRIPANPAANDLAAADKKLQVTYNVPYVQHSPMEPRAAVADWDGDNKLTVWTATQNPFAVRGEVANALRVQQDGVRVIVPDFGGGFGGKHSGECAVEASRLAKAAGKPVSLRWTRAEEFTWAYFRPAAVIKAEAHLDGDGSLASWYFVNIDGDGSALQSPYRSAKNLAQQLPVRPTVLRHGSYRALGSTANNFARESFMDELAELAGKDPLEFRLAHLPTDRLRAVLQEAAKRFDWSAAREKKQPNRGVGLACGTEKGSYVAACAEVEIDPKTNEISIRRATEVFECGAVVNPENLRMQVLGALIMGLGPALREEMKFEEGQITNAAFSKYLVPRFDDVPQLDIHLLDRPDLASAGAGETPIIAIAPAIANAVFHATGQRIREMPIRLAAKA